MKKNNIYEGKNYKLKKNSIKKLKHKYDETYNYVLTNSLKYKKYINEFKSMEDDKLLKAMESTAKDLKIDNNKIYNYNSFNKKVMKSFYKLLKEEKKNRITIDLELVKDYKLINDKKYKDIKKLATNKPNKFLKALYLYTICED